MAPNATSSSANLPHLQIVDRLVEYPLVNNALGYANQGYAALKSSNSVITQTLDRAEKSFHLVVTATVVPVLTQLEQPIKQADSLAVQSLDLVQSKIDSIQKSGEELKDSTRKLADQTVERYQALKSSAVQSVQSKAHQVWTLPSNVVPLLDQILSAGESVLDYLLPSDGKDDGKSSQNGSPAKKDQDSKVNDNTKDVIRLIIVRMGTFSDKVQKRIVNYSRDRWVPALFERVVHIRSNLVGLLSNGTTGKLVQRIFMPTNGLFLNPVPVKSSTNNSNNNSNSTTTTTTTTPALSPIKAKNATSVKTSPKKSNHTLNSSSQSMNTSNSTNSASPQSNKDLPKQNDSDMSI